MTGLTAHVISLPRRTDRREQFAAHAAERGIPFRFVDGIEGQRGAMRDIAAAHKGVVRMAMEQGLPHVLVMEDDCYFPHPQGWQWFLHNSPATYCDLYLGGIYSGAPDATGRVATFCATHCYVVHAPFYHRFLQAPDNQHLDHALSSLRGHYQVCQPFAAIQREGFSDQAGKVVDHSGNVAGRYFDGTPRFIQVDRWDRWQKHVENGLSQNEQAW